MRFSSLVSLVVVTASLALGGCAADAEPASSEPGSSEAALTGLGSPTVEKNGKHGEYAARADDAARTRIIDVYTGAAANVAKAQVFEGDSLNRAPLATVGPQYGAHIPQQEQLSLNGNLEAHEETATSSAKRLP